MIPSLYLLAAPWTSHATRTTFQNVYDGDDPDRQVAVCWRQDGADEWSALWVGLPDPNDSLAPEGHGDTAEDALSDLIGARAWYAEC